MVEQNKNLFSNIRLWDYRALDAVYKQFQEIRLYYEFVDVDIDRYHINNDYRQVMVAARELELSNLPQQSQTFVNQRFKYTHGYGITLTTVSEFTPEGLPNLLVKDIPPKSKFASIDVERPEIYYGELTDSHVIVNSKPLPLFDPLPDTINGSVLLKVGDDISTDEIMPAGYRVLPYRSNIPEISKFVYEQVDPFFYERAMKHKEKGFIIIGGKNYGQGSSREHAAIATRYLGLKVVIAKSFARIHFQNLINFGILPLVFVNPDDYDQISQYEVLVIKDLRNSIQKGTILLVTNKRKNKKFQVKHLMSQRQLEMILAGSLINIVRNKMDSDSALN